MTGTRPEVRHLEHFVAVAEELNFTRAARRLHIVQQALSASIAQLERQLRVQLLERSTRRVALTEAGMAFLERARGSLAAIDGAVEEARQYAAGDRGGLRIGLCTTGGLSFTPMLLDAFKMRHPGISLQVRHFDFSDPTAGLADATTDVALVRPPFESAGIEIMVVDSEPRSVVLPARHSLARRTGVRFAEVADEPWMTADTDPTWCHFWRGDAYRERPASIGAVCTSFDELLESARTGQAIGLVPASLARSQPWPGLAFVPVIDLPDSHTAICWRSADKRPGVRKFVTVAEILNPLKLASVQESVEVLIDQGKSGCSTRLGADVDDAGTGDVLGDELLDRHVELEACSATGMRSRLGVGAHSAGDRRDV